MPSPPRRKLLSALASITAAVLAIALVSWALFTDRDLYDLRWKLQPGEVLRYRVVMKMGSTVDQTYQEMFLRYTVAAASPDGDAEITNILEQATIRKGGPDGPVVWESTAGSPIPKDYAVAVTAVMVGVPIRYTVDVRGNVLAKDGMQVIQKRLKEVMGDNFFTSAFTEVPFAGTGESLLGGVLSSHPVRRGTPWTHESGAGTQTWGKTTFKNRYTLQAVRKGVATIVLTESKTEEETPGDIAKAMNLKIPADPAAKHGNEELTEFSIAEGVVVAHRSRGWSQSTTTKGTLFRFEMSSETTLIERKPHE